MKPQLQQIRKRAGFKSAKAFAEHVGINPNTYTQYEQGIIQLSFERACELADALDCSLDELAGREVPHVRFADDDAAKVVDTYNKLDETGKEVALTTLEGIAAVSCSRDEESRDQRRSAGIA